MNPTEKAQQIVDSHIPEGGAVDRGALADAIRWAIVQGQIAARQPPEVTLDQAPAIARQIVWFIDDYLRRMRGASYVVQADALRYCRARVLELHGIVPLSGQRKLVAKAKELKREAGA